MRLTSFPGFAYSLRKIAAPTPIGVAISMVISMIINVLTIFPAMPTVPCSTDVTEVRKPKSTTWMPFTKT